jgi:hypothetical protein
MCSVRHLLAIATRAIQRSRRRTSRRISRVLCSVLSHRVAAIHLDLPSPAGSSDLPAGSGGPPSITCANRLVSQSILLDLAPGGVYLAAPVTRNAGGLLHRRFTLTESSDWPTLGGFISVALSRGSPRVAVSNHPALWSPDFPRLSSRKCWERRRGRPVGSSAAAAMVRACRSPRRRREWVA